MGIAGLPRSTRPLATDSAVVRDIASCRDDNEIREGGTRTVPRNACTADPPRAPGLGYLLARDGTGRCGVLACECFPPWRGPNCRLLDEVSLDSAKETSKGGAVVLYDARGGRVPDLCASLALLWPRYNRRVDLPVVVLHDGALDSHAAREEVRS